MCGRYALTSPAEAVRSWFNVAADKPIPPRYNIAPTQPVLAVRLNERGMRELAALEWGLQPEWAKERRDTPLINARVETVAEKPSFRSAFKRSRCLVPFNAWYEWQAAANGKQPYAIEIKDTLGAFAGIWTVWHGPGGDHWLETMAILTGEADGALRSVHHRKPLVVSPKDYDRWLTPHDPLPKGFLDSFDFLGDESFTLRPVSRRVNDIRFDDPACLAPPQLETPTPPPAQRDLFGD